MTRLISLICLVLLVGSCTKHTPTPGLPQKLKVLTSANPDCICDPYIDLYKWRGQYIFFMGYKGPACDWAPLLYDAAGEPFVFPTGTNYSVFFGEKDFIRNDGHVSDREFYKYLVCSR
ncbi:hypothetical protein ACX0G7_27055 [Flavitalea antarctica]